MSLINDVLREVEERRAGSIAPEPASPANRLQRRVHRNWWAWLLLAIVLGATGQVLYSQWDRFSPPMSDPRQHNVQSVAKPADSDQLLALAGLAALKPPAAPAAPTATAPASPPLSIEPSPASSRINDTDTANAADSTASAATSTHAKPDVKAEPLSETQPTEPSAPTSIAIQRSGPPRENHPVDAALRALTRNQHGVAESRLQAHLDQQPDDTRARLLLSNVLLNQERIGTALEVLERGLSAESASELGLPLARLLQEMGRAVEAREVLQRYPPALADQPDYHLLLAALERQLGAHTEAAELYRRLTEHDPNNPTAWVGLGASLETLNRQTDAREAYQAALALGDARLAAFARQRLAALSTTGES